MRDELGIEPRIFLNWHSRRKDGSSWYLEPDTSLRCGKRQESVELVSPPMRYHDAIAALRQTLRWMRRHGFITNASTGFHVSISIPEPHGINFLKLALLGDLDAVAKRFKRERSGYARSITRELKRALRELDEGRREWLRQLPPHRLDVNLNRELWRVLRNDRYFQVNVQNFTRRGYSEFRVLGNKNYHRRADLTRQINRFCDLYVAAATRDRHDDYHRELARITRWL